MILESIATLQNAKNSFLFYLMDRDVSALGCTCQKMRVVATQEMQRRDAELRVLLSPFTLYRQFNIEDPVRARLFGLGERHGADQNTLDRSRVIFHLSLRGPVILLIEGITFLEKCEYFFEKRWVAAGINEKLSVFVRLGDPFLSENLLGFGWDCQWEEAQAKEREDRENAEASVMKQVAMFPDLLNSSMKELFYDLEKVYWRGEDPASFLLYCRIERHHTIFKIMEQYILRSPSLYVAAAAGNPDVAQLFQSWSSSQFIAEQILNSNPSDPTLLARPEILESLHQGAKLFALVSDPLLLQEWKNLLVRNGIFYEDSGEIIDSESICPGLLKDSLSRRLLDAFQEIEAHLNLLKYFINGGFLELLSFEQCRDFFTEWHKNFQQFETTKHDANDRIFPYRTLAMVHSIKSIRSILGLSSHNSFLVVQAGANHLKPRQGRKDNPYLDLTPLYQELSQHEAVILTHSDTF